MARVFARMGWRVLYVESVGLRAPRMASQRDWGRLWRRLWRGVQSILVGAPRRDSNIWVFSPLVVPALHHWPLVRRFNQALLSIGIGRFASVLGFRKPLVWTYHPFMMDAVGGLQRGALVYHCVDDLAAIPGVDVDAFSTAERRLLAGCDVVFATAMSLKERCEPFNPNTHFLANVVDAQHFGRALEPGQLPAELIEIPEPRIVYHGVLSDFKVDFSLLLAAARARSDWQWVFIGEEREGQRSELVAELAQLANVHFLGYRSYARLPDYLRAMQVGLLPSLINDYTKSMFPMKFFEYLAAGLPVVSTPLAFTEARLEGLEVGADADSFIVAIENQLARGRLSRDESCHFVGDNTWDARTIKMLETVRSMEGHA
ncbi:glycosyltransferase [Cupriavidus sp. TMH.W2]|uniref:glycosyltransferase n=1 Tax=Cupriavidus sp. TMH.W2 TaxID=3434465 RepID=UPI003D789AD4